MFTDEDMAEAERSPVLGPHYFDANRVAKNVMEKFEAEQFKPLIDDLCKQVSDKLWDYMESSLLSDTEMNLQGQMWRMVDYCVKDLLTGKGWALKRWGLGDRYDDAEIRAAVAKHVPIELQDKRVADLEKEVERLQKDLNWYKDRR